MPISDWDQEIRDEFAKLETRIAAAEAEIAALKVTSVPLVEVPFADLSAELQTKVETVRYINVK